MGDGVGTGRSLTNAMPCFAPLVNTTHFIVAGRDAISQEASPAAAAAQEGRHEWLS